MPSWFAPSARSSGDLVFLAPQDDTGLGAAGRLPAGLRRIGRTLPDPVPNELPHAEVAAVLRREPGVWFEFPPTWPTTYSGLIMAGRITAYRPAGSFEALVRSHTLYARYVGEGGEGNGNHYRAGQRRAAA